MESLLKLPKIYFDVFPIIIRQKRFFRTYSNSKNTINIKLHQIFTRYFKTSNAFLVDYYRVLGVNKSSSSEEIKKAYFKKVKEFHPDVNKSPDASERFREVKEAYDVLGNPEAKRLYDSGGSSTARRPASAASSPYGSATNGRPYTRATQSAQNTSHHSFFDDDIFSSIFDTFATNKKFQVQETLYISFQESITGCSKIIPVRMMAKCSKCQGRGHDLNTSQKCGYCKGKGSYTKSDGRMTYVITCESCYGTGYSSAGSCHKCSGNGYEYSSQNLKVDIPAGIDDGKVMLFKDQVTDVLVTIRVKKSALYQKIGDDIHSELLVDMFTATLGGEMEGSTVHGNVKIKIPAGTNSHSKLRISGHGVRRAYNNGDHVFDVKIIVPKTVSNEAKRLINELKGSVNIPKESPREDRDYSSYSYGQYSESLSDEKVVKIFKVLLVIFLIYLIFMPNISR